MPQMPAPGSAAFTRAIALDNHLIMSDNLLQD
jgi:hypothetical protein